MNTVYKYELKPNDYIDIEMPASAKILSVQKQGEKVCLWAFVDPGKEKLIRRFKMVSTGSQVNEKFGDLVFIDTFQLMGGNLVFHVFEVIK